MLPKTLFVGYLLLVVAVGGCRFTSTTTSAAKKGENRNNTFANNEEWKQTTWESGPGVFSSGKDSGYVFAGGMQVQADGSVALSRVSASSKTFNSDLNNDGYKDIIIANSGNYEFVDQPFAQIRHKNQDHSMPDAKIYWGGPNGYDPKRSSGIPGERPSSLAVMDFNLDGILDIAVAGGGEFHPPYVNSRIYWGTRNGYSEDNCTLLPTNAATGTAVGDFNKDGYPDVVFANLGDYNFPFPPSLIYWGSPDGFSAKNRTELETHGVGGLAVADVNNDGWPDIVFGNSAGFPPIDQLMDYGQNYPWPDSYIYLGGPHGFSNDRRISLPTKGATGVKVADLNHDGYPDLVFANAGSFALPPLPDTYIYWGGPNGYSTSKRTDLRTNGASAVSIADLDKDGWPDLVLSVTGTYLYIGKPDFPNSFVYWGGPDGFSDNRRLALHTEGSQGAVVTDVNGDGILDLVFSQLGDFSQPYRPVLIYYGTGDKKAFFSASNSGTLPGQISYGSVVVGAPDGGDYMSHGNREIPKYDNPDSYLTKGDLTSSARYCTGIPQWTTLEYSASVPAATKATLIIEGTNDEGKTWKENGRLALVDGRHGIDLSSEGIKLETGVRYKLDLQSIDGQSTPILRSIDFK